MDAEKKAAEKNLPELGNLTFPLLRRDIKHGQANSPSSCPLALALKRHLNETYHAEYCVRVRRTISVSRKRAGERWGFHYHPPLDYALPPAAQKVMQLTDGGRKHLIGPQTITLVRSAYQDELEQAGQRGQ